MMIKSKQEYKSVLKNYDKENISFKFMPDNVDDRYKVEPDITLRSYQV